MNGPSYPRRFGPYVLLSQIGAGGVGTIELGCHADRIHEDTLVVIKRLNAEYYADPQQRRRLVLEGEIAVSVEHPQIVRVLDIGAVDDEVFLAMEYIEGWSLAEVYELLINASTYPPIEGVVSMVLSGLDGLKAMHSTIDPNTGAPLGIIHRDLSPKNLIVGPTASVHLIDLGLGRSSRRDWKTATGMVMGSPGYMAPEQAFAEKVDHRADVYGMGTVLYEALVLQPYIPRGDRMTMLKAMQSPDFVDPKSFRSSIPDALTAACKKALALKPNDRFADASAFADALIQAVPSHKPAVLAQLLHKLGGEALANRRAEIGELIDNCPTSITEAPHQKTQILVRRPGFLQNIGAPQVRVSSPILNAPQTEAPVTTPRAAASSVRVRQISSGRKSSLGRLALGALFLSVVAVTAWIVRTPSPAPPTAAPIPAITVTDSEDSLAQHPAARPSVTAKEAKSAPAASPRPSRVKTEAARPAKRTKTNPPSPKTIPTKVAPPPVAPIPKKAAAPVPRPSKRSATSPTMAFQHLQKRASAAERRAPAKRKEINAILSEASFWVGSSDQPRAIKELNALRRRVDAL